jgi:hypothetical protein
MALGAVFSACFAKPARQSASNNKTSNTKLLKRVKASDTNTKASKAALAVCHIGQRLLSVAYTL